MYVNRYENYDIVFGLFMPIYIVLNNTLYVVIGIDCRTEYVKDVVAEFWNSICLCIFKPQGFQKLNFGSTSSVGFMGKNSVTECNFCFGKKHTCTSKRLELRL